MRTRPIRSLLIKRKQDLISNKKIKQIRKKNHKNKNNLMKNKPIVARNLIKIKEANKKKRRY